MKIKVPFRRAITDPNLLGKSLSGKSWDGWKVLGIAAMGEPLTEDERVIFKELTGREQEPLERAEEFVVVAGRRAGKTEADSTIAAFFSTCVDYSDVLVAGEVGVFMIVASDQEQAIISLDRVEAKIRASPLLQQLIVSRTISYELSPAPKSVLYGALLPLLNSERIELPDNARLISQLAGLERRTARGGKDSIDHSPGQHDDVANCVAGLASLLTAASEGASIELLQRCNGTYDEEEAAQRALQQLLARGEPRPTSGPLAPGAVSLGHGGYRAPRWW